MTRILQVETIRRSVWDGGAFDPPETQLHVIVSAALLVLAYLLITRFVVAWRERALYLSAGLVTGIGVVRELWNHWEGLLFGLSHKFFSMWDMVWNLAGVGLGIVAIRLAQRLRAKRRDLIRQM